MTANAQQDSGDLKRARAPGSEADGEAKLDELRSLLVGREIERIDDLGARLDDPARYAEDVSRALPDAVSISSGRDDRLATALRPTVEEAVRVSVRRDAKVLVDALFPVIGPAIRKAVAAALGELVQALNRALDHSLSLKGLKWRLEALRTGRPFAEIVLTHSIVYRVEQVFLIHGETGLLLQHVVDPAVEAQEGELVSGMLTAIQDFARDSLNAEQTETLDAARVGGLELLVERGPHATIAGVVRGQAPIDLRRRFVEAIEAVHDEMDDQLADFDGDATPFEAVRPHLEACLTAQFEEESKGPSTPLVAACVVVGLVALALGGYVMWQRGKWNGYVELLRQQPGIVVVDTGTRDGKWYVSGLRDPAAADPVALLAEQRIDPSEVLARWEPYHSLAPEFLETRARDLLEPPPTVSLRVVDGVLALSGEADHEWIVTARRLSRALPGVARLDESALVDASRRDVDTLTKRLESFVIRFDNNTAQIAAGQEGDLEAAVGALRALFDAVERRNLTVEVDVVGHTDSRGDDGTNSPLSEQRARAFLAFAESSGLDTRRMRVRGVATSQPVRAEASDEDAAFNRSVTFDVKVAGE